MDHHCACNPPPVHTHACNASLKSGRTRWRRHACQYSIFACMERRNQSPGPRLFVFFFFFFQIVPPSPHITLISRRHVESHQDQELLPNSVPAVDVMDGGKRVFLKIIYLLLVFNSANLKKKCLKFKLKSWWAWSDALALRRRIFASH